MAGGLIHASAPSHVVCAIHDDSQVGAARRRARQVADLGRLDAVLKEHVAIVATELATNMLKHASGGELLIQPIPDESFHGVELIAVDRGPGLPDVARALLPQVAEALNGSPFSRPGMWRQAVVILRREEKRVTSRADFAGWLAANDLRDVAREATARRIPPGSILVSPDPWLRARPENSTMAV